jgi:hypothetical protein
MSYQSRQRIADQALAFATSAPPPSFAARLAMALRLWRERIAARR